LWSAMTCIARIGSFQIHSASVRLRAPGVSRVILRGNRLPVKRTTARSYPSLTLRAGAPTRSRLRPPAIRRVPTDCVGWHARKQSEKGGGRAPPHLASRRGRLPDGSVTCPTRRFRACNPLDRNGHRKVRATP
jgi:hypothetical protein